MTELLQVTLGELYSLLGEKDVKIYQLEKQAEILEKLLENAKPPVTGSPKKDPFKKDK